jgi:hypothetical protein
MDDTVGDTQKNPMRRKEAQKKKNVEEEEPIDKCTHMDKL